MRHPSAQFRLELSLQERDHRGFEGVVVGVDAPGIATLDENDVRIGGEDDMVPDGGEDVVGHVVLHGYHNRRLRLALAVTDNQVGAAGGEDEHLVRLAMPLDLGEVGGRHHRSVAQHGDPPAGEVEHRAVPLLEPGANRDKMG